jgi:hypothetical protein
MTTQKSRRRTWIIALVSIAALAVTGTVTLIGLGVYAFVSNVDIEDATSESADATFEEALARLAGDEPLIHVARVDGRIQAEVRRRDQANNTPPESLHVMVWDPDDERLVNIRIPLWLLRFGDNATVDFSAAEGDIVGDLDLTLADIDHHGPGLVLDFQDAGRERVLLWAE